MRVNAVLLPWDCCCSLDSHIHFTNQKLESKCRLLVRTLNAEEASQEGDLAADNNSIP